MQLDTEAATASAPVRREVYYKWHQLHPSPTNPRQVFEGIEDLADSIRSQGLLQPLLVRPTPEGPEVVAGGRRYRALGTIDVHADVWCVEREMSDAEVLAVQIVENLQRQDVHPLEEADGFRRLQEIGLTAEAIAQRVGKAKAYVYSRLKLATLRAEAREAFRAGKLNASIAEMLARIPTPTAQSRALAEVLTWGEAPNVRRVGEMIEQNYMVRLAGAPFDQARVALFEGAPSCAACPSRTGNMPELQTAGGKAGTSADVCTDPECYRQKVDAEWEDRVKKSKAAGAPFGLLDAGKLEELRRYGWVAGVVRPIDVADGRDPKRRAWRDLFVGPSAKHAPKIRLARNQSGDIVELYDAAEARAALKKAGYKFGSDDFPAARKRTPEEIARDKQREAAERARDELRKDLMANAPAAAVSRWPSSGAVWRWLVDAMDAATYGDLRKDVLERHKVRANDDAAWEKFVGGLTDAQCRGLFVEILLMAAGGGGPVDERLAFLESARVLFLAGDTAAPASMSKPSKATAPAAKKPAPAKKPAAVKKPAPAKKPAAPKKPAVAKKPAAKKPAAKKPAAANA